MLNQPFHGQLGELLCEKLGQPLENTACFTMFSAFAKNGGVLRLKPSERFKNAGGYIRRKNSTVPRSRNKRNGVICRSTSRRLPRSIKTSLSVHSFGSALFRLFRNIVDFTDAARAP